MTKCSHWQVQSERSREVCSPFLNSTDTISQSISNLSATGEEIAASSTEGLQTAEHAVEAMKKTKEIIDATYLLAQDLESYAE